MASNLPSISDALIQTGYPRPSQAWISTLVSARVVPPLPALIQTARIKLSKLDLLTPGLFEPSSSSLPHNITNPGKKEVLVNGPVVLQVLEVYDIGRSKWEQIEGIEAIERGEKTKGREIIRDVPNEDGDGDAFGEAMRGMKSGPHKLLLQDWKGQCVYGMEVGTVPKVGITMAIGCKVVVRDFILARGVAMLDANNTTVLGGEIKELNEKWIKERKKMLQDAMPKKDG